MIFLEDREDDGQTKRPEKSHLWGSLKPKFYIIDILYWITVVQFRRTKQVFFFCVQRLHKTKKKLIWIVSIPYASPRWFPQSSPYHEKLAIRKGSIDWGVCLRGWGGEGRGGGELAFPLRLHTYVPILQFYYPWFFEWFISSVLQSKNIW